MWAPSRLILFVGVRACLKYATTWYCTVNLVVLLQRGTFIQMKTCFFLFAEDILYDVLRLKENENTIKTTLNNSSRDSKSLALESGSIEEMMLKLDHQLDETMESDTCWEELERIKFEIHKFIERFIKLGSNISPSQVPTVSPANKPTTSLSTKLPAYTTSTSPANADDE